MIRPVTLSDAPAIASIYNHYIEQTVITFEFDSVTPAEIASRIEKTIVKYPYLVYEEEGQVLGYAYVGEFRSRVAYRQTGETSIYLHPEATGRGIGKRLLKALLDEARKMEFHVLIGVITIPNDVSVALHEQFGFKQAGCFHEVGRKFNRWLDVGYWELLL